MDDRFEYRNDREAYSAARVRALEALLIKKGIITDKTVDTVLEFFQTKMGPFNGAKIVARAWLDPTFKARAWSPTRRRRSPNSRFRRAWRAPKASTCAPSPTNRACTT